MLNKYNIIAAAILSFSIAAWADFENLGQPVRQGFLLNYSAGPDANGDYTKLYFAFGQPSSALLVEVTPGKRAVRQFTGPKDITGPWGFAIGGDNKIYLGCSGHILVFDPKHPDKQLVDLGKPAQSETVIWRLAASEDGIIYGSTYPNCKLVSYDTNSGAMADLGRLDMDEQYARPLTIGSDGWVYTGVGSKRGNVVAYNPKTGQFKPILADNDRPNEWGRVGGWYLTWKGGDGFAYGEIGSNTYKFLEGKGIQIPAEQASVKVNSKLADGRELTGAKSEGNYHLKTADGTETKYNFDYRPNCPDVFLLAKGPDGMIYGSTITPLVAFSLNPQTKAFKDLGKITAAGGEVYSFANYADELFICSYPEAKLSRYNPFKPVDYGTSPKNNPFDYGAIGADHSRPRAMVAGANGKLYIGGYPEYGKLGGALSVFDPNANLIVNHHKNLVANQSIISLASSQTRKLIFAGTSITGGNGIEPTENQGRFFVWDIEKGQKTLDIAPVEGHKHIVSMCSIADKVYMLTSKEHSTFGGEPVETALAVYNAEAGNIEYVKKFDFGRIVDTSIGVDDSDAILALTSKGIISINPVTFQLDTLAKSPVKIEYGFAIADKCVYFASGADVWRYRYREAN